MLEALTQLFISPQACAQSQQTFAVGIRVTQVSQRTDRTAELTTWDNIEESSINHINTAYVSQESDIRAR